MLAWNSVCSSLCRWTTILDAFSPAVTQRVFIPRRVQFSAFCAEFACLLLTDGRRDLSLIAHHLYFIIYYLPPCLWRTISWSPTCPLTLSFFEPQLVAILSFSLIPWSLIVSTHWLSCHPLPLVHHDWTVTWVCQLPYPYTFTIFLILTNTCTRIWVVIRLNHETPARSLMSCMSDFHCIQHGLLCRVRHQP